MVYPGYIPEVYPGTLYIPVYTPPDTIGACTVPAGVPSLVSAGYAQYRCVALFCTFDGRMDWGSGDYPGFEKSEILEKSWEKCKIALSDKQIQQ